MNTELKALYQEASDFFTYVKLYAPDFPNRDEMTCEKAITKLFEYLGAIDDSESNSKAKQWLRISGEELKRADRAFGNGEHSQGRRTLGSARDYLNNAAQRKSVRTTFTADENGQAQDLNKGFPS